MCSSDLQYAITPVVIPVGATYGFFIGGSSSFSYATATASGPAGSVVANDANISITSGHGGPWGSATFNPRAPVIEVYYGDPNATAYTFAWSTGDTTEDISNLTMGPYIVAVTDCNGCTTSGAYFVMVGATPGCMDSTANNYNQYATIDDSSCYWLGCTDTLALNFDSTATVNDTSCVYPCSYYGLQDVTIVVTTNPWPYEVSWNITNANGEIGRASCRERV